MNHHLTEGQWLHAVHMWAKGVDTLEIAQYFNCPEPLIYRKLPFYRGKYKSIEEPAG